SLEELEMNRIVPTQGDRPVSPRERNSLESDRLRSHRESQPSSFVPRRSPDMGAATFPLTPSIGPGSGSLGPEAGRGGSRTRPGMGMEEGRRAFGGVGR
ncbi:MAG TPA: hypothetical protein PLZ20_17850, partial [Nitrospira sp.]|nr:hypothetical protein [Nitrospira sp.]